MLQQSDYNPNVPIYLQIVEKIKENILSDEWKLGDRVPSVRELSCSFGVNPNTMQRALAELERDGLLYSERTAGRFVTKDSDRIADVRKEYGTRVINLFISKLTVLGYTREQIAKLILEESM